MRRSLEDALFDPRCCRYSSFLSSQALRESNREHEDLQTHSSHVSTGLVDTVLVAKISRATVSATLMVAFHTIRCVRIRRGDCKVADSLSSSQRRTTWLRDSYAKGYTHSDVRVVVLCHLLSAIDTNTLSLHASTSSSGPCSKYSKVKLDLLGANMLAKEWPLTL